MSCFGWCGSEDVRNPADTGPSQAHNSIGSSHISTAPLVFVFLILSSFWLLSKLIGIESL